jgi:trimethylamine--corrinoid protein Co-methyltransferase
MIMTQSITLLHDATLKLLEKTGVRVDSREALDIFAGYGVRVDFATRRVYPTEAHIALALSSAPRRFPVYGRRTLDPLIIGNGSLYVISGGASLRVYTLEGRYEAATWEHLRQFNTLLDALPNIHMLLNQVDPQDGGASHYYQRIAAEMLIDSAKPPLLQAGNGADVTAMVEMGAAIRGSRQALAEKPVFMTGSNAEPPLCIPQDAAEIVITASRAGVPCSLGDYAMMGVTAPITVAGALVQRNAVQLTALMLAQFTAPGAPFCYVGSSGSADMRTLNPISANPHALQVLRGAVELGVHYELPVIGLSVTDAKLPDAQAANEMALTFMVAMQSGASLIQGATAMMDQMMLSSFAQAIIDHDIVSYLLAVRQRPEITPETLALSVIDDVVNDVSMAELKFAMQAHTAHHMRDEQFQPQVFTYRNFTDWTRDGQTTLLARAEARARDLIAHHRSEPLAPDLTNAIQRMAQ